MSIARRLGLVLLSLVIATLLVEGSLRAAGYRYSPVRIGDNVASDHREEHAFHDRNLVYDPDLIWRPVSRQFSPFNPQGFRGPLVEQPKPAGAFRVFALGDSNTFGWDVDEGVNWPAQLHRLLSVSRPGAEVVNAGVWGYSSFQGLQRFKEVLAYTPDLVLISYGGNDAHQVRVPDEQYVRRHDRLEQLQNASRFLRLAQLGVAGLDRFDLLSAASGPLVPRVSLDAFRRHVSEIVTLGRERNVRVVLLTRPFVGSSTDPTSWKTHAPSYNEATLALAADMGVAVIDVHAAFRDRPNLFDDESHFGVEGHRTAAQLIHAALLAMLQ